MDQLKPVNGYQKYEQEIDFDDGFTYKGKFVVHDSSAKLELQGTKTHPVSRNFLFASCFNRAIRESQVVARFNPKAHFDQKF